MKKDIFREKSIKRISNPEQLDTLVRVTSPGAWIILVAAAVLLLGIFIWGIYGHMTISVESAAIAKNGQVICYVSEANISDVDKNTKITINGKKYSLESISGLPKKVDTSFDEYILHTGTVKQGDWVYELRAVTDLPDGVYKADITTRSMNPISFALN